MVAGMARAPPQTGSAALPSAARVLRSLKNENLRIFIVFTFTTVSKSFVHTYIEHIGVEILNPYLTLI